MSGVGCNPGAPVSLTLAGRAVGSTVADAAGHFSGNIDVGSTEVGRYNLVASCGSTIAASFDVVVTSKVAGGGSTAVVIVLLMIAGLGYLVVQFGSARRA